MSVDELTQVKPLFWQAKTPVAMAGLPLDSWTVPLTLATWSLMLTGGGVPVHPTPEQLVTTPLVFTVMPTVV